MEWYENLPSELKEAPFLRPTDDGVRDINQVVADLTNAAQHMGNSIRIPGADAGEEAMAEFRNRAAEKIPGLMVMPSPDDDEAMNSVFRTMGMPEEATGYRLPEIEGLELPDDQVASLREAAHGLKLTQQQFEAMVKTQHEQGKTAMDTQTAALQEGLDALKQEWGAAFDSRVDSVKAILGKIDAPQYVVDMVEAGTLPASDLKMFHAIADMVGSEGSEISNQEGQDTGVLTPDQALNELSDIEGRADRALFDPMHPDHERLKKRRVELMMLAYPDSDAGNLRSSIGG